MVTQTCSVTTAASTCTLLHINFTVKMRRPATMQQATQPPEVCLSEQFSNLQATNHPIDTCRPRSVLRNCQQARRTVMTWH